MRLIVALFVLKVEFELKFLKSWTTERNLPLFFSAKGGQINREATHSRIMRTTPDNNRVFRLVSCTILCALSPEFFLRSNAAAG